MYHLECEKCKSNLILNLKRLKFSLDNKKKSLKIYQY